MTEIMVLDTEGLRKGGRGKEIRKALDPAKASADGLSLEGGGHRGSRLEAAKGNLIPAL